MEEFVQKLKTTMKDTVQNALDRKYLKGNMIIKRIGKTDMGEFRAKAYCSPVDDESLIFNVIVDVNENIIDDNYCSRKLNHILEKEIQNFFENENVDSCCNITSERSDISIDSDIFKIIEDGKNPFYGKLILNSKVKDETILNVFQKIIEKYPNIDLSLITYIILDDGFLECKDLLAITPRISATIINQHKVDEILNIAIKEKNVNIKRGK